jgi:hypothetical protein
MVWFRSRLNWSRALPAHRLAGTPRYGAYIRARRLKDRAAFCEYQSRTEGRIVCTAFVLQNANRRESSAAVPCDGTLTIILSGLREFQQMLEFLIGATLAYLAIVEITKRIFYMSVAKLES